MSRLKSVLLVDFDNIYGATSEEVVSGLPNWLLLTSSGKAMRILALKPGWRMALINRASMSVLGAGVP